ncbi:DNA gyrase C-terminal beta-propeller domain-containing protein, partial [Ligilactobacillus ruminis]
HVGLKKILESYLEHQRIVVTKRTEFDLNKAKERKHIVDGLIKALSILDDVIKTIRASKNKKDAKANLVSSFDFTEKQAEAIVSLQLYRLTNTDVTALQNEAEDLERKIVEYTKILNNGKELDKVIKKELKTIDKKYGTPRLTEIRAEIEELKIDTEVMVAQEDVMLLVSRDGYVKRSSLRSFKASDESDNGLKEEDVVILMKVANTLDHLLMFTNKGNVIYRPIHDIVDSRWKDTGEHLSQTVGLSDDERVIEAFTFDSLEKEGAFVFATKEGMIKQTLLKDLKPGRTYRSRAQTFIKLKTDTDEVIMAEFVETENEDLQVFCTTHAGYGLRYLLNEVPTTGARTSGVKCMDLRDDFLISVSLVSEHDEVAIVTQRGAFKKMKVDKIPENSRARRGVQILRELKRNPHRIFFAKPVIETDKLIIETTAGEKIELSVSDHPSCDRYSNGSFVLDTDSQGNPCLVTIVRQETDSED